MGSQLSFVTRRRHLETRPPADFGAIARYSFGRVPWPSAAVRGLGVYGVSTADAAVALTFDDGPSPVHTPGILDALAAWGAHATFFVLADRVRANPEIVRDAIARGHEVGLHGADHRSLLTMTTKDALESITGARRIVEDAIGESISLYRPAYGHHTWQQGRGIHSLGLEIVQWSGDAVDWLDAPAEDIADRLSAVAAPGAILLAHDDRADPETLKPGEVLPTFDKALAVDRFLAAQAEQRVECIGVSELLRRGRAIRSTSKDGMARR